jgi:hypothetical protein
MRTADPAGLPAPIPSFPRRKRVVESARHCQCKCVYTNLDFRRENVNPHPPTGGWPARRRMVDQSDAL